jgi:16S rRNA (guanine527-N7)-methyltransferase
VSAVVGRAVDAETQARLDAFGALLIEVAIPRGFVSEEDRGRLVERHILDSARATRAFAETDRAAVDIGSGAGLPGIPLAILLPLVAVTLVEPRPARAAFLELAVERLGLTNVSVVVARAEDLPAGTTDVATARAFAPLERSWELARPLLREGGKLVYFAGRDAETPPSLPGAGSIACLETPVLATSGRLIIIAR